MSTSVTIVIPVFNQAHLTERCLESVLAHSKVARHLVVVNNASTDSTASLLQTLQKRFHDQGWDMQIIANSENVGFGRACNQGIRLSQTDYVAILNNDTWLMRGWDEALIRRQQELNADMIAPYYDETPYDAGSMDERADRFVRRNRGKFAEAWVSVLMFFPKRTLDVVGLFDERFFVTYEDTDLKERMIRAKMSFYKVADCFIWHHSKATRDQEALPSGYEQEGLRLFTEKWGFDPRVAEHTRGARLKRRWRKIKIALGLF